MRKSLDQQNKQTASTLLLLALAVVAWIAWHNYNLNRSNSNKLWQCINEAIKLNAPGIEYGDSSHTNISSQTQAQMIKQCEEEYHH